MKRGKDKKLKKEKRTDSPEQMREKIRYRAYELFELRGGEHGLDLADWLQAEAEVIGKK